MKKSDANVWIFLLLLCFICATGFLGWVQSTLEPRKFTLHKYSAYATSVLAFIYVVINFSKLTTYFKKVLKEKPKTNNP